MMAAEIRLIGVFKPDTFSDWICHRARLLDLMGSVSTVGLNDLRVVVQGPQALVDAMEIACSLGPMDADVQRIEMRPMPLNRKLNGFQVHH